MDGSNFETGSLTDGDVNLAALVPTLEVEAERHLGVVGALDCDAEAHGR